MSVKMTDGSSADLGDKPIEESPFPADSKEQERER